MVYVQFARVIALQFSGLLWEDNIWCCPLLFRCGQGVASKNILADDFINYNECLSTNEKICSSSRKAKIVTAGIHLSISRITI